ncbi:phage tail tip fiber protein, partial [Streptomyces sp. G35A]
LTSQITIQASQIGQNQAAIVAETQTRVNKDNAIASAVNNIWAAIGGNFAVIQDGQLAQVNPSGAQATKWTQVQSEVIDPNTGRSKVASIRQDFSAFSDKVNNKFGSLYTVRAQITSSGRTIVGGFGLSALDGPDGPTIDFGVRADRFW